jgi:hypothetical protein
LTWQAEEDADRYMMLGSFPVEASNSRKKLGMIIHFPAILGKGTKVLTPK